MARRGVVLLRRIAALGALGPAFVLGQGCELIVDGDVGTIGCSAEGAIGPPACPDEHLCREGSCVALGGLGRACSFDAACAPRDLCLDPALFGLKVPRFCTRPCCSSSDCDPSAAAVCWIPDGAAFGFCRVGAEVGRPRIGVGSAGEPCAGGFECRSGVCAAGACVDTCCSDAGCAAGGGTCQLSHGLVSGGEAWACLPARAGTKGPLEPCAQDKECASAACLDIGGELRCAAPCCGSGHCAGLVELPGGELQALRCDVVTRGDSVVRACAGLAPAGATLGVGAPCQTGEECRSGICFAPAGGGQPVCSDMCCTDQVCGDLAGLACRPEYATSSWGLRCELK